MLIAVMRDLEIPLVPAVAVINMVIFYKNFQKLSEYREAVSELRKEAIEKFPEELKPFESFNGRINFSDYTELFNFENKIYGDKQFKYSLISNYNARLIPEFSAAAFAKLIFDGSVKIEIRGKLEQYQIAIMANMDYRNFATIDQFRDSFKDTSKSTYHYVIGSCASNYKEHKFRLLHDRLANALKIMGQIYPYKTDQKVSMEIDRYETHEEQEYKKYLLPLVEENSHVDYRVAREIGPSAELTKHEVNRILKSHENKNERNYKLVFFTSTSHVSKLANELEKYFYEHPDLKYPNSVSIIGLEKFFDLITNRRLERDKDGSIDELFILRKMQNFLCQIFMHSLDRNQQK